VGCQRPNTVVVPSVLQVGFKGAPVEFERAFNPSRSVRRGWAIWYRAPVVLSVIAALVIVIGLLADSLLREIEVSAISEMVERIPPLPYGVTIPSLGESQVNPIHLLLLGPSLLLLVGARALFDLVSFRIHKSVLIKGQPSSKREGVGVVHVAGKLFLYYLMAFGAVVGSIVVAGSLGLVVIFSGVNSGSAGVALVGLVIVLLTVLPVYVYVNLGVCLGSRILVYGDVSAVEALERSWALAKGNRWSLVVFKLILSAFVVAGGLVGLLLCGVGLLLSLPVVCAVASAAFSEAFILATRFDTSSEWRLPIELGETPF